MKNATGLTFFCELEPEALTKLFQNRFVLDDLRSLGATVSLGILDFSKDRAEAVRKMNKLGIPVTAWLLLPKEQGYWFNLENFPYAIARYEAFTSWSKAEKLHWAGVGVEIEPDIQQINDLLHRKPSVIAKAFKRWKNTQGYQQALLAYTGLVNKIHADGYSVEAYEFPLIVDDRKAKSTTIQQLAGLIDIPVDREVLMLYSSFIGVQGHAMLWSYAQQAQAIGIGSTGGGVSMEASMSSGPALNWEEFSVDLRLATRTGKPIYVYSLEGCVQQGFFERLITFDVDQPVKLPKTTLLSGFRNGLQGLLWLLQRPFVLLIGILGIVGSILFVRRRKNGNTSHPRAN